MSYFYKAVGIAIVSIILCSLIGETKRELVIPLKLCCAVTLLTLVAKPAISAITRYTALFEKIQLPFEAASVMLKGAIVCIVCTLCSSLCRESSNSSLADVIELSGRLIVVALSFPLVESAVEIALRFV